MSQSIWIFCLFFVILRTLLRLIRRITELGLCHSTDSIKEKRTKKLISTWYSIPWESKVANSLTLLQITEITLTLIFSFFIFRFQCSRGHPSRSFRRGVESCLQYLKTATVVGLKRRQCQTLVTSIADRTPDTVLWAGRRDAHFRGLGAGEHVADGSGLQQRRLCYLWCRDRQFGHQARHYSGNFKILVSISRLGLDI